MKLLFTFGMSLSGGNTEAFFENDYQLVGLVPV